MSKRFWIIIGLIVTLMVAAIIVIPTVANYLDNETSTNNVVQSNWYNYSWLYRKPITINNTGSLLTNYQMQLNLDLSSVIPSHMLASGNDIIFTSSDGQTVLNYWIQSISTPSAAVIWVKVPSIPVGSPAVTIYMYYGNLGATAASSGSNTFIFFEDFEGGVAGWTTSGTGSFTQVTSPTPQHGSYAARFNDTSTANSFTVTSPVFTTTVNPVIVELYEYPEQNGINMETRIQNGATIGPAFRWNNGANIQYDLAGTWTNVAAPAGYTANTWYNIKLDRVTWVTGVTNDLYDFYVNGVSKVASARYTADLNTVIDRIVLVGSAANIQPKMDIDLVKVRVYAATPPTLGTMGAEE